MEENEEVKNADDDSISLPDDEKNILNESAQNGSFKKEMSLSFDGFNYNPLYPEEGESVVTNTFDIQEITGDRIISTLHMYFIFEFDDDHFMYGSETNTGDIFNLTLTCRNRSGGYVYKLSDHQTYPGGGSVEIDLNCDVHGEGIYYDTEWTLEVEISNCGTYSKYLNLGLITEPDMGNDWNAYFEYTYSI